MNSFQSEKTSVLVSAVPKLTVSLIKTEIPCVCLKQRLSTPSTLMRTVKAIWAGFADPLKGLQIWFWYKETGAKSVAIAMACRLSFCFFCDVHFDLTQLEL